MRILGRAILFAEVYAIFAAGVVAFAPLQPATAADFTVTTPNNAFVWTINGMGNNPTLTLVRGKSYTFAVSSASFHPFEITNAPPGSVTGNNTFSGTVTFNVPADPGDYGYHCSLHNFGAKILTVAPPPPPTIQILSLTVDTNLVLVSTGTNTWSVIPEFNTDLSTTNWFALTVQSNRFVSGTNETYCGRPPGDAVYIRIRSQPN